MSKSLIAAATALSLLGGAATAHAQDPEPTPTPAATATPAPLPPPGNDARTAAATVTLGTVLRGDTTGSTLEPDEPPTACGTEGASGSVWYRLPGAAVKRDLVLELDAGGKLDAVVDVYRQDRSQLAGIGCGRTDANGKLTLETSQAAKRDVLIRVAPVQNSEPGQFTLRVVAPDAPEPPPGRQLPSAGAAGTLDRTANPDDAYGVSLKAGRTYRVRLVSPGRCVTAGLYAPGTSAFADAAPVKSLRCDAYTLFTPKAGEGGRYALQVLAPRSGRSQAGYRIAVAAAGDDDTAPGRPIANDRRTEGSLRGSGTDVLDLYRFAVRRRSILDLTLKTGAEAPFDVRLVTAGGKRVACACGDTGNQRLRTKVKPGRYFVAVRSRNASDGGYVLRRLTRTITKLRLSVPKTIQEGSSVAFRSTVTPGADGPVAYDLERFDPLAGWQFDRRVTATVSGGSGTRTTGPLAVGRWRVTATFRGTRRFAPAPAKTATFTVEEPIPSTEP